MADVSLEVESEESNILEVPPCPCCSKLIRLCGNRRVLVVALGCLLQHATQLGGQQRVDFATRIAEVILTLSTLIAGPA